MNSPLQNSHPFEPAKSRLLVVGACWGGGQPLPAVPSNLGSLTEQQTLLGLFMAAERARQGGDKSGPSFAAAHWSWPCGTQRSRLSAVRPAKHSGQTESCGGGAGAAWPGIKGSDGGGGVGLPGQNLLGFRGSLLLCLLCWGRGALEARKVDSWGLPCEGSLLLAPTPCMPGTSAPAHSPPATCPTVITRYYYSPCRNLPIGRNLPPNLGPPPPGCEGGSDPRVTE